MIVDLLQELTGPDEVVVEVGVDSEKDTVALAKVSRQVYALEPNPFAFKRLERAVRKKKNVQLYKVGAGETEESIRLRVPELSNQPQGGRSVEVQIKRLDRLEFALSPTCLVVDCGGFELQAIRGAEGLISSGAIRKILLKSHQLRDGTNTSAEATLWLLDRGFRTLPRKGPDGSIWITARAPGSIGGEGTRKPLGD